MDTITTEALAQNKKLIAEFMGVETIENFYFNLPQFPETRGFNSSTRYIKEELKYDTSWDWLMPVVEKIETIVSQFNIRTYTLGHTYTDVKIIVDNSKTIDIELCLSKKEAVYNAVVEFIKWYNEQKPPQKEN